MPDRYLAAEDAQRTRMENVPRLVKFAWDMALLFPEYGDEVLADLREDLEAIVKADVARLAEEAEQRAREQHHNFCVPSLRRAAARNAGRTAALVSGFMAEGMDPFGYYVYLLWPAKNAEKPVYVGQSRNLFSRLGSHMTDPDKRYQTYWVTVVRCEDEASMEETERELIAHYSPALNTVGVRRHG